MKNAYQWKRDFSLFIQGATVTQLLGQSAVIYQPQDWWFASQFPLNPGHVSLDKALNLEPLHFKGEACPQIFINIMMSFTFVNNIKIIFSLRFLIGFLLMFCTPGWLHQATPHPDSDAAGSHGDQADLWLLCDAGAVPSSAMDFC